MYRREFLKGAAAGAVVLWPLGRVFAGSVDVARFRSAASVDPQQWEQLAAVLEGKLLKPISPFSNAASAAERAYALKHLDNPFFIGDQPALTQTSGWADAWQSQVSPYVVEAHSANDVALAIRFARLHNLRVTIRGGGHSYHGTSNSADGLLIWTRRMNRIEIQDAFDVTRGSMVPAVAVQSGAMWIDAYDKVTTQTGRYVQGGGCTSVGTAGLISSGGFGSFSKQWGTAAANLLQAQVVTADGQVRICDAKQNPDLYWAIKGGGGGNFGVITQMTLRTHDLPEVFGAVFGTLRARTDDAYLELVKRIMRLYSQSLFNANWGEQIKFKRGRTVEISMLFQGISETQANQVWQPLMEWAQSQADIEVAEPANTTALPARHFWDVNFLRAYAPSVVQLDYRDNSPAHHMAWKGDTEQAGWRIHGYESKWLPQHLLSPNDIDALCMALCNASKEWSVSLHFNKGMAGGDAQAIERTRATAMNPQVLDAFALAIIATGGAPAFDGMGAGAWQRENPKENRQAIRRASAILETVAPQAGCYVSESDYFLKDWKQQYWGSNARRLSAIKKKYDPLDMFHVHHGA